MAVTRRGYIFSAFLLSVLCVLLILVAVSSDSWIAGIYLDRRTDKITYVYWVILLSLAILAGVEVLINVVSTATAEVQIEDSSLRYGLFRGELVLHNLATPTFNTLYMTCVVDVNACALSCKTEEDARIAEVRALAERFTPSAACASVTEVNTTNILPHRPVISFAFYVSELVILFLQLGFAIAAAGLAILNATKNPTEPIFGLPGCLWANIVAAVLGTTVLLMFGIYWLTSGLKVHLATSYIAQELFEPGPALGYSYWILTSAILCSLANVGFILLRGYLLERDPPPPTIKLENHSDGTIFLY